MKQIRFGIIGTGNITRWFLHDAALNQRFKAVALYSRTSLHGSEFARETGIPAVYTSLDEMLQDADIDAVYIASPNHMHASQAIKCMNHGKPVLCEKPLASNAAEAGKMIAAARKNGVTLMEAMISTLNPNFDFVKSQMHLIGKIRRYVSSYCQYSSRYDKLKAGELPNVFNPKFSSGALMDIGIYTIYPMVVLFGKPESIKAEGIILPTGVDGQGTLTCRYPGMEANLIYSKIANSYLPTEIQGNNFNMLLDAIHNIQVVKVINHPTPSSGRDNSIEPITYSVPCPNAYLYEVREFIGLIESKRMESSVNSLAASLATLEIIDEARRQLGVAFPADLDM